MKEHCKGNWPGMGLICAGLVVFFVGLAIVLFKELNIPGYFIPLVVGLALIVTGVVIGGMKRMGDRESVQK